MAPLVVFLHYWWEVNYSHVEIREVVVVVFWICDHVTCYTVGLF